MLKPLLESLSKISVKKLQEKSRGGLLKGKKAKLEATPILPATPKAKRKPEKKKLLRANTENPG